MRIISGTLGGRRIQPPGKMPHTRPTTDLAKGGLFNTLQHLMDFNGIKTLDLFGGTGSISYELASRGAADLTIIEKDRNMVAFISKTLLTLNIADKTKLIPSEVFRFLSQSKDRYDFVFAGPPYALETIDQLPDLITLPPLLQPEGIFVLEHTPRNNYEQHPHFFKTKNYGTTVFTFFKIS